jgi:hypothetical protein
MIDLDLNFPVFDDRDYPSPVLTMDEYSGWVHAHWRHLSVEERRRAESEMSRESCTVRFCISEGRASSADT